MASNKGASSVLVILLLLVLVVFGIAALTTALSGLRLGLKVSDWSEAYYGAEGIAAYRFAEIDKAVSEASKAEPDSFFEALSKQLAIQDFETTLESHGETISISFDSWNGDIGLHVVLEMETEVGRDLRVTQWRQIQ
jgi:Tfp pilus assembly protein PilX